MRMRLALAKTIRLTMKLVAPVATITSVVGMCMVRQFESRPDLHMNVWVYWRLTIPIAEGSRYVIPALRWRWRVCHSRKPEASRLSITAVPEDGRRNHEVEERLFFRKARYGTPSQAF
jgi:hypothetical protein